MAPNASMTKVPWVGHRFEIRCLSGHISNSDASWKDVSSEVAAELSQICEVELRYMGDSEAKKGEEEAIPYDVKCPESRKRQFSAV